MRLAKSLYAAAGSVTATLSLTVGALAVRAAGAFDNNGLPTPSNTSLNANTSGTDTITAIADLVLNYALLISGIVAVLFLIFYGYQYITAGGDADKVKKARAGIVNAVIGVVVILSAFLIIRFAVGLGQGVSQSANSI